MPQQESRFGHNRFSHHEDVVQSQSRKTSPTNIYPALVALKEHNHGGNGILDSRGVDVE